MTGTDIKLVVLITNAVSTEEALGKGIIYYNDEMKNFNLHCKVVINLTDGDVPDKPKQDIEQPETTDG